MQKKLFAAGVFQLGREVPIYILQYLILSFGGVFVLQDQLDSLPASTIKKITHIVMDRPVASTKTDKQDLV